MYRLMIADDEENIRCGIARGIPWQEMGYEVCALCADGQEVLDRMDECRPDVVLSDIRMPGMDGVELMQRLREGWPQVKIVILSGYSDFEYLNMSIKNHVTEYLLKPTDFDEFEEVFRRLKTTLDHERLRSAELNESVRRHFESWLGELLQGLAPEKDTQRFLPMLTEAGIDTENLVVAVFTLDGHGGDEKADLAALWRRVLAACAPVAQGALHRLLFLHGEEMMVGFYSAEREFEPDEVLADIRALQQAAREEVRATLSAGVSELCSELDMLPQGYEQANCCAKQNVFAGSESIYHFRQLGQDRPESLAYFDTDCIEKALLGQDYDALRSELDRVFATFGAPVREYLYADRLCLSLLFHVSLWGLRYGVFMADVMRSLGANYTDIYQCDTLPSKRCFVLAILFGYQQALAGRRSQGHAAGSVALRVREYVDERYCSNTISLEEVASHVHKTPAYVSRVFKNELECNFSDYLTEKRMRHAAELLLDPDCRVYEIAEQCGYADASGFIRVFKKFYGVSPADYRAVRGSGE